ncbi:LOW QUALITY PROTEIN: hypothetical protein ColTof4_06732 [Colletotrichum tofieldiae]|nr:LOW QUALITY PROTEIN: hypothetical protein ColTof3_11672 [Colletotrichum tofieldiae]GKT74309.1 LOW QUALITY PROTEIN: hypothetical protein ColTof4_06732 [Colletotrichum tofieldiae]
MDQNCLTEEVEEEDRQRPVFPYTTQYEGPKEFYDTSLNQTIPFDSENLDTVTDSHTGKNSGDEDSVGDPRAEAGTLKTRTIPRESHDVSANEQPGAKAYGSSKVNAAGAQPRKATCWCRQLYSHELQKALETFFHWVDGRTIGNNQELVITRSGSYWPKLPMGN